MINKKEKEPVITKSKHKRLVAQMEACPFCDKTDSCLDLIHFHHWASSCGRCDARGPVMPTPEMAVAGWNKRPSHA